MQLKSPSFFNKKILSLSVLSAISTISLVGLFQEKAHAEITKIVIESIESPTFEGVFFGSVGQYEKLRGKAYGEVDPKNKQNSGIVDIEYAPININGKVEYVSDIFILRPIDKAKSNKRVLVDVNNRGNLNALRVFNDALTGGNNPGVSAGDAGNGFLMSQGFTMISNGWDITPKPLNSAITISVPIAKSRDGLSIVGPSLDELVVDNNTTAIFPIIYPIVSSDKTKASLTVRNHYADAPTVISSEGWEYTDSTLTAIRLLPAGTKFSIGSLYEFTSQAKDPVVAGLGFAATRDVMNFFKTATTDKFGTANPLDGYADFFYGFGVSQPSRFMRDFVYLGFNRVEKVKYKNEDSQDNYQSGYQSGYQGGYQIEYQNKALKGVNKNVAFDGIFNWIGGGSGMFMNHRFAQPGRTHRQHIARWMPEPRYPDAITYDPIKRKFYGMLIGCQFSNSCPKIFEVNSENEYWAKAGSTLHTDINGRDLEEPGIVRNYFLSGAPHGSGTAAGICQQPQNPLKVNAVARSLIGQLSDWTEGKIKSPPQSRLPKTRNGTLVAPLPQSSVGFPTIPGVTYSGVFHEGDLYNFGPSYDKDGIMSILPPMFMGAPYVALVPKTDIDGNDIAGVRLPELSVPIATFTGWALRSGPAAPDGCDAAGQRIPFAATKDVRDASGDPRLSISERYTSREDYANKVLAHARQLQADGFLLEQDVQFYYNQALVEPLPFF